jgi:ESCRT-II complex subunit VPS25
MKRWSNLILDWCRYHRTYRLSLIDAAETPLFHNARLRKHMGVLEARAIVDYMAKTAEEGGGGRRAEWVPPGGAGEGSANAVGEKTIAWVWWRRPEEWATLIADWVGLSNLERTSKEGPG